MFINQGAESFKIWTGKQPNILEMKYAVLNKLKEFNMLTGKQKDI